MSREPSQAWYSLPEIKKKKLTREGRRFGPQTRKLGFRGWTDYSEGITVKIMKINYCVFSAYEVPCTVLDAC